MAQGRSQVLHEALPKLLRRGSLDGAAKLVHTAHAADLASLFRKLTDSQRATLFSLVDDTEKKADMLSELSANIAGGFLPLIDDEVLVELLTEMSGDDAADIVELLDDQRRDSILRRLSQAGEDDVAELFHYEPESAAGIMTPDVFALRDDTMVSDAIETLQLHGDDFEIAYYLYVVNQAGALVGVLSLRKLVLSPPDTPLSEIMETDVVRVDMTTDQEEVARIVARYNLLAVPVVNSSNILVGAITVDDIIDVIRFEATEDMLKMAGAGEELDTSGSALSSAKARLPWLLASFFGGVIAALLIGGFEETIAKVAPLAAFIPIVLGMGGNVGIQSATIVTRGLALGQVDTSSLWRVVAREFGIALICGISYGVLLGALAAGRYAGTDVVESGIMFGLTVGLAVAAAMIMAASVGAAIPIVFARLNADPALASGPFVTTTVDVLGIAVYFGIAMALLGL